MQYTYRSVEKDNYKFNCRRQKFNRYFHFQIIRQDVYTDMNVVPILPLKKYNSTGRVQHLNAYALDFFKHGSQKVIEKENGLVINTIIYGIELLLESVKLIFSYFLWLFLYPDERTALPYMSFQNGRHLSILCLLTN